MRRHARLGEGGASNPPAQAPRPQGSMPAPIGRDPESAAAAAVLDAATTGPAALVLTGPAGIGKTTIWRAMLTDAHGRGYTTVEARAIEKETQLAFGGLADLLDPVIDEVIDHLPPAQRMALEVALQRTTVGEYAPPPLAVSMGTAATIRALADRAPVLVAVDDLDWLDGPSAHVLEYAMRRIGGLRVALVATSRVVTAGAALPALAAAFDGPVTALHVGPLDLDAIDEMIRRDLGFSLRRPALSRIHRESRGNPFLAREMARTLGHFADRPGVVQGSSSSAAAILVQERLQALPARTRWALATIAALGRPSLELVRSAVPGANEAVEAGCSAGVLEVDGVRVQFTHPLLAEGAFMALDDAERRLLHRQLADVITDPEQRAQHLALSSDAPSETVADELERAANHAGSRGSTDAAAELALQAARRTPPDAPDDIRRRIIEAGSYFIRAGDPVRARAVLEECIATAAPGSGRAEALRVLADARSSDDWHAKVGVLEGALAEAGGDHRLRSLLLQDLAEARWHTASDAAGELKLATAAVEEADLQDDPSARCSAYLALVFARFDMGAGLDTDLLGRAMALGPLVEHQRVFLWPAFAKALTDEHSDRLGLAIATLLELRARATQAGDWDSLPIISSILASATFRRGSWQDARGYAVDAERGSRQNGQAEGLAFALSVRAMIEAGLGHAAAARRIAQEGLALARGCGGRASELANHAVLGFLELSLGNARDAVDELERAVRPWMDEGFGDPWVLRSLPDLAESLILLDRAAEAVSLLLQYEESAVRLDRPSARACGLRIRGLLAGIDGDEDGAEAAFGLALEQHARVSLPFEQARTLLAQGQTLRRFRRRGLARDALSRATESFEQIGAGLWHERASAELARTGHRETGSPLTSTELQVAELVVAGRTNREVGEALFMSRHTVEAHLTRIYRSLGIRGRTDLARVLSRQDSGDASVAGTRPDEGHG